MSSHIFQVGYDRDSQVLSVRYAPELKFPGGRLVQYLDVPEDVADTVISADSVGSAMHRLVRGKYQHRG